MKSSQCLLVSCTLALALAQVASAMNFPRQTPPLTDTATTATTTSASTSAIATSASIIASTTSDTSTSSTSISSTSTSTSAPPSNTSTQPIVTTSQTSITPPPPTSLTPITTTNAAGDPVTVTETSTLPQSSASSASSAPTSSSTDSSGGGLGTGSIIGMSVAGGIALIVIIAFFVWKFTRKRFSDFDDSEAIKWPELNNTHGSNVDSHPLPVHSTGRAGFETGSEASLSRANSISNYSTPDLGSAGSDPYAVPPLPHLNPNQPYRDDPTGATGYYDPYRGPVPGTLEHGTGNDWAGEAIPMTQMAGGPGRMSPGPHAAYEAHPTYGGEAVYDPGRRSPGPQAAYGGRTSPGPQIAYGGRSSPGPQVAYGGRTSPGPQAAYVGRASPGPQAAYDAYGGR